MSKTQNPERQTLLEIRLSYTTATQKMSQARFAKEILALNPTQYCLYETMQRDPFDSTKAQIAQKLGRSIHSIIWTL